ncbi:hypothetical protein CLV82_2966 [Zeaxanthinibacter enoshimensis]|uniref:Uncharacterized protein n=2 Tax=Zeaxanthinibacter enoshimensis TaxID=392009 RepID=A0A4R6TGV5_9FLAO|nr:hypothetical protein CLV82_2966 [Zeaxanthinibacter enoshimensis]
MIAWEGQGFSPYNCPKSLRRIALTVVCNLTQLKNAFQIIVFFLLILLPACEGKESTKSQTEPTVVVKLLDSSRVNQPLKAIAILLDSEFTNKNSQIFVALEENGEDTLKKDLSNEYELAMEFFANLEIDSFNQKWLQSKDKRHSAVFGKTFANPGKNTIRGYVWDFYGFEVTDSIIPSQSRKYYFEFEVHTMDNK